MAAIETALQLPHDEVDQLIAAGQQLVRDSDVIQQFIQDLHD